MRQSDGPFMTHDAPAPGDKADEAASVVRAIIDAMTSTAQAEPAESRADSILQGLPVGLLAITPEGTVAQTNAEAGRLFSQPCEALKGMAIGQVLDGVPDHTLLLETLFGARGGRLRTEWNPPNEDGRPRSLDLTAVAMMPMQDPSLIGMILAEDRTQARLATRQTVRRERLASQIALAHQITAEPGAVPGPLDRARQFLEPLRLGISRVSLKRCLLSALAQAKPAITQNAVQVCWNDDLAPDGWIAADGDLLEQAFGHLIANAIQAMPEGGQLSLSLAWHDGAWEVMIRDEGVGIPAEMAEKVFDLFFTTKEDAAGLGLTAVHQILTAHGAQLEIVSRPVAGTACFVQFFAVSCPGL